MEPRPPPSDQGKMWAALSYGSFFIGFPLGVVPLLQRDDPYALFHAKHATAVWLAVFVSGSLLAVGYVFLSIVTFGLGSFCLLPVFLLPFGWSVLVGVHGLVLSLNGEWQEPLGTFGLGELLFGGIVPKEPTPPPQLPGV